MNDWLMRFQRGDIFQGSSAGGSSCARGRPHFGGSGHSAVSLVKGSLGAFCLLIILLLCAPNSRGAATHPFNVRDLVAFDRLADLRVSPNGQTIVFTVSSLDLEANKRRAHLWLAALDGTQLRQLTAAQASDSSPRWSPDGKTVWFLSARSGSQQVWKIALDGGEAQPVTRLPLDVGSFALSRDGTKLAVSLGVFIDAGSLQETKKRLDETKDRKTSGRIYDHLLFRHWDAWSDGRRSHLFVMPAAGGAPVDIMKSMDADAPSQPFGGDEEFTFTPDGSALVFTAKDVGRAEAWSTDFDLWVAPADGSSSPRKLTDNPAWDSTPCFSPDGVTLAYLAMKRPGFESDRARVVLRAWPDGPAKVLTEDWDRSPSSLAWSADGKELFVTAENLGQESLFAVDVSGGQVRTLVETGAVRSPQTAGDQIVLGLDTLTSPTELYSLKASGGELKRLTDVNREKVASVRMGEPEQFTFPGWNAETVHAYLVKPVDFDPAKKYPVAFLIHGGPQGSFGNNFHYRWNVQTYAGAGYAVVMVDFHGSTGYGQAFTDAIRGDWGGKPLEDLKLGLAAALQRYPLLDGQRVAALGASYGAYMVNWIAGAWPDRFRCLVSHDGNLDERAAYFMTEELWFPEWEHLGTPWDNAESYEKQNPSNLVRNWKTPILVIHGGLDFRIADAQGFATFTAAQRRGIPSKLLYFPDESHWVLKPQNSILWHDTVIGWLNQWTK
jgi:dipeptidyl aminopeptidase/acylaminoacyl peptidase